VAPGSTRDWDASTYERVSGPQEEWALEVMDRLPLRGDETVVDAGCGSGRVTRHLIERLPEGRVIAVDGSPSMVEQARGVLRPQDEAVVSDLLEFELSGAVDAVFSTATFHWISDHDRLFERLRSLLRPGGLLVAQCGGEGNVARTVEVIRTINEEDPFAEHLGGGADPWNFVPAAETAERLEAAGFGEVECWLSFARVRPEQPRAFAVSVCLGPELDGLPRDLHDRYVDRFLALSGKPLILDYVRLNIGAVAA
jgi:trans-aconitate 2-methyltransferase